MIAALRCRRFYTKVLPKLLLAVLVFYVGSYACLRMSTSLPVCITIGLYKGELKTVYQMDVYIEGDWLPEELDFLFPSAVGCAYSPLSRIEFRLHQAGYSPFSVDKYISW